MNRLLAITYLLSQVAFAEPGFLSLPDARIPAPVQAVASQSVLRIVIPDGHLRWVNPADIHAGADEFTRAQLAFCIRLNENPCPIFDQASECSAFVAEQSNQIYTALHCLVQYLRPKALISTEGFELAKRISRTPIPVFIFNQRGEMIYPDASAIGARIDRVAINREVLIDQTLSTVLFGLNDVIKLDLQKPVGVPLQLASGTTRPGLDVYAVGLPSETHNRRIDFGRPDALGQVLHVTHGRILDTNSDRAVIGESTVVLDLIGDRVFYTDADGEHGLSGGLFCDGEGRVVGVYTRQQTSALDGRTPLTTGVRATALKNLPSVGQLGAFESHR